MKAFDRIENQWKEDSEAAFNIGFPHAAYTSSTALVALIHDDILYVANAGDSKAILVKGPKNSTENTQKAENSEKTEGKYTHQNVSTTFNCNKKHEQERIRKEHPGEKDAVYCVKGPTGPNCFVKGCLQPTKSFGDYRLKYHEFNFHTFVQD